MKNIRNSNTFYAKISQKYVKGLQITKNTPTKYQKKVTDIILIDIISFSTLSSYEQVEIITFLTKSYRKMIQTLLAKSEMTLEKLVLGFISTGDGFYCVLNPRLKGFGTILALSFSHFSDIIAEKYPYFRGIRIAVHTGEVYPFTDILGHTNFVGDGLNDCARYVELKQFAISTIVVSKEAYASFERFLELYEDFYSLLLEREFKHSNMYTFYDKHGKIRKAYLVWLREGGIIKPPHINFNSLMKSN